MPWDRNQMAAQQSKVHHAEDRHANGKYHSIIRRTAHHRRRQGTKNQK